jgi:large subunit ribosomal protein L15
MRQYIPLSLLQLQRLVDLGRINPNEPIDMTTICNSKVLMIDDSRKQYGFQLTDEVNILFGLVHFIEF